MNTFIAKIRRLRSPLSARNCRRVVASLGLLLIAFAAVAATTAARNVAPGIVYSGGNLILLPGWPGLAPALY